MTSTLDTVVTIPVVAFDQYGGINEQETENVSDRMVRHGISVLTINGNTGEFYSLSPEERRRAVRIGAQFTDRAELVAGIGFDLSTAKADAEFAVSRGITHLMVHQPPHPFVSAEGWLHYHLDIAKAFPDVNFIPYVKSSNISEQTILQLIDQAPNIGAIKYAVEDPTTFGHLVAAAPRELTWICGVAEKWAPPFWSVTGVAAFTSGLANVSPKVSLDLYRALKTHDSSEAARLWKLVHAFEQLRSDAASKNNVSVVKEALAQLGWTSSRVRAPISAVDTSTVTAVETFLADMQDAGYIDGED